MKKRVLKRTADGKEYWDLEGVLSRKSIRRLCGVAHRVLQSHISEGWKGEVTHLPDCNTLTIHCWVGEDHCWVEVTERELVQSKDPEVLLGARLTTCIARLWAVLDQDALRGRSGSPKAGSGTSSPPTTPTQQTASQSPSRRIAGIASSRGRVGDLIAVVTKGKGVQRNGFEALVTQCYTQGILAEGVLAGDLLMWNKEGKLERYKESDREE